MSRRNRSSRVAWLVALLMAVSHAAAAAPARHHKAKPKRTAPATDSAPTVRDDPAPAADSAPTADSAAPVVDDAAPAEPEEPAPTRTATRPKPSEDVTLAPVTTEPPARTRAPRNAPAPQIEIEAAVDEAALGRREAARIAAGRIEVAVSASVDVGRRQFTYSDPIGMRPRSYLLKAVPLGTFGLEAYPLASTDLPFLRDLGFRGHVSRAFAIDSSTTDGVAIDTTWTRFGGEVRERVLLPGAHPVELGVVVGVDASEFGMSAKGTVPALVPAARTVSLRFGVDGRLVATRRLSLLLGGAYLATLSRGEIYDRFRRPRVAGVDAEVGAALELGPGLEARLVGRYTRYFASFDPEVGDAAVAGGALDEQMQLGVGLRYAH